MRLQFSKMHGLGNDFVVLDATTRPLRLDAVLIRHLADRRRGVGCDQVLLIEPSTDPEADFRYRIFNADGGEVEQCGNGARCVGRFLVDRGLSDKTSIVLATRAGAIAVQVQPDGQVRVNMGSPRFRPAAIPFLAQAEAADYPLDTPTGEVRIGAVSMGNPHAVLQVADVERAPVAELGAFIESHPRFPQRANVGFMQVVDTGHIRLRVFERGVGETQACGTGACAAVAVGRHQGLLRERVEVDLPGGRMQIEWPGEPHPVWMTGPAVHVFDGWMDV